MIASPSIIGHKQPGLVSPSFLDSVILPKNLVLIGKVIKGFVTIVGLEVLKNTFNILFEENI